MEKGHEKMAKVAAGYDTQTLNILSNTNVHFMTHPIRVQSENLDPWELQEKKVLLDSAEIMDLQENKENVGLQDHQVAQETKGTLERTAPR